MDVLYVFCFKSVGSYKHKLSRIESLMILSWGINCIIRVSNNLDPDQARHIVWPDLGSNCLQKLSADGKWPQASEEIGQHQNDQIMVLIAS